MNIADNSLRCRPPHTILNHLHLPSLLTNYLPAHSVTLFHCFFFSFLHEATFKKVDTHKNTHVGCGPISLSFLLITAFYKACPSESGTEVGTPLFPAVELCDFSGRWQCMSSTGEIAKLYRWE